MGIQDTLLNQGYVPKGVEPKTVLEPGEAPVWASGNNLARALRGMEKGRLEAEKAQKDHLEREQKKADYYNTLRDAGYSTDKAFGAAHKGIDLPGAPEQDDRSLEVEQKKANLAKTREQTEKIKREATEPLTAQEVKDEIARKVAAGEELTPGQERLYKDTMKKKSSSGGWQEYLETEDGEDSSSVKVYDPKGKPGVYQKDLWERDKQKLLRKGWRLR